MLTLIKRALAAAIVVAAIAAPAAAYAQINQAPIGGSEIPVDYLGPTHAAAPPANPSPAASSVGFQWGDAGIGAGSLLVLIGVGAGAGTVAHRRRARPLAN